MAGSDDEQGPQKPSEQRGGTTPDDAEAREKGQWAGTAEDGVVPPDLGGSDAPREMLADAVKKGVKVKSANVMTMYFGPQFTTGKELSDVCIASAQRAHEQCQKIDPAIQIGLTPMIGKGGERGSEVFDRRQAGAVYEWAKDHPWVCSLSFWCSNRDSGKPSKRGGEGGNTASGLAQQPWDFSNAFKAFTGK